MRTRGKEDTDVVVAAGIEVGVKDMEPGHWIASTRAIQWPGVYASGPSKADGLAGVPAAWWAETGSVFDVSQTEGEPLPESPSITEDVSTNDVSQAVNLKLSRWVIDQGLRMESIPINGHAHGFYSPRKKRIGIRLTPQVSPFTVARTKTLAHETTHYLADHKGDGDRHDAEMVAEAPAFVAMNHFNLDTGDYSFHYLTGWAEDKEHLHTNLEEIRRIIRAVEGVGDPCEDEFGSFEAIGTWGYWPKRSSRWKRRSIGTPLISEDMPGYIDRCLDRFCSTCADVDTVNCVG